MLESLFNTVAGLKAWCFPVNFAKIYKCLFLQNTLVAASVPCCLNQQDSFTASLKVSIPICYSHFAKNVKQTHLKINRCLNPHMHEIFLQLYRMRWSLRTHKRKWSINWTKWYFFHIIQTSALFSKGIT